MFKKLLVLFILIISFGFFTRSASAATDFSSFYDVQYSVNNDGSTTINEKITLKNETSQYYASNYSLSIGSTTISDVSASNDKGPLDAKVEYADKKTTITVNFSDQVAGIGKTQTFNLTFKSKDFAQAVGKTWEVNLPKIPASGDIQGYNLTLSVPVSFGEPTSIAPNPVSETQQGDRLLLHFTQDQLRVSGVSVNFGSNQTYSFTLTYNLDNQAIFPAVTSITLPPDTPFQDVLIQSMNPAPTNVTLDKDGNMLAWYTLNRRSSMKVIVTGMSKLYIHPKDKNIQKLTSDDILALTETDKYWEKDNPLITATLNEIFKEGKPQDTKSIEYKIYRYVVDTLKYDTNRIKSNNVERLGAVTALNNPDNAVCMEFTDLFIALSRAAGVPAREMDGFAYTQNTDLRPLSLQANVLHAWPEYYDDKSGWVMVDPTWENTSGGVDYFHKFDLNHFALAIKGYSSQTPFITDDVKVEISETDFNPDPKLAVEAESPDSLWSGLPGDLIIKVSNTGQSIQPVTPITLDTANIGVIGPKTVNVGPIPPYGYTEYKYKIQTPNVWQTVYDKVQILVGGQTFSKTLAIKPFLYIQPVPYVFLGVTVAIVILYFVVLLRHIRLSSVHKKKSKAG